MKAYVTSIGEPTTELCCWALERNGFSPWVIAGESSLNDKLKDIYLLADQEDQDFIRIDADVIVNKNFTPKLMATLAQNQYDIWWWQFKVFDLLKLDSAHSIGYIRKEAIKDLVDNLAIMEYTNRPETEMSRIKQFYSPRRFDTYEDKLMGVHGLKADLDRVKLSKRLRNQQDLFDFDMAERIQAL